MIRTMRDIPCCYDHLRDVRVQQVQEMQVGDFSGSEEVLATHARALVDDGLVLACFGVIPMWDGVGQAWAILSDEVLEDRPMELSRTVKQWLDDIEKREGFHRIQAAVAHNHWAGYRWIKWLGFKCGCKMENYGLGGSGDFHLYARVH